MSVKRTQFVALWPLVAFRDTWPPVLWLWPLVLDSRLRAA